MDSKDPIIHDTVLPGFKCSDVPAPSNQVPNPNPGGTTAYAQGINAPIFDYRRPEAYERMAGDKLGEELAPDATIWKLYLDEAAEHDQELVEGRHNSLDMLLLFAALFSAILTAFLIESKNLLQQDPQDVSAALLLLIAQSQHRMELGLPPPAELSSSIDSPGFTPTLTSRWINGIWFTSLGLSLTASLIAMLGKEWLTAFLSSRPRPAHAHALLRQSRLEGLERWWALHIIALLPSLLHLSLLLFSVGLVVYLGTLDTIVAIVLAGIVGLTTAFYFVTAILGAVYEYCPFVTELSGYARQAIIALFNRPHEEQNQTSRAPSQKDLQALLWLANNARDPAVVDCSYQALAGLHTYLLHRVKDEAVTTYPPEAFDLEFTISRQIAPETDINTLLHTVITRFDRLSSDTFYLASMPVMAFPRYISAMAALASLRDTLPAQTHNEVIHSSIGSYGFMTESSAEDPPISYLLKKFSMSDNGWIDNIRSLPADAFASILISEYNLFWLAVLDLRDPRPTASNGAKGLYSVAQRPQHYIVVDTNIDFPSKSIKERGLVQLDKVYTLREHYERWVVQVCALLQFHSEGKISITNRRLEELLTVMTQATQPELLNSLYSAESDYPHLETSHEELHRFVVPLNGDKSFTVQSGNLWLGPLVSLIKLLTERPGVLAGSPIQTCISVLRAYAYLVPMMLPQVLQIDNRNQLAEDFDMDKWAFLPTSSLTGARFICVRLVLLTLRYIGLSRTGKESHLDFCLELLNLESDCRGADADLDVWDFGFRALAEHGSDLIPILELARENDSYIAKLPEAAKFYLLELARNPHTNGEVTLCDNILTPKCFIALISMIGTSGYPGDEDFGELLSSMTRRMRNKSPHDHTQIPWNQIPAIEYLHQFTHTSRGFLSIATASTEKEHESFIAGFAVDVIHMAAGKDPNLAVWPVNIDPIALPGLLKVIKMVSSYYTDIGDQSAMCQLASDAVDLMTDTISDGPSRTLLTESSACQDIWDALCTGGNEPDQTALSKLCSFASTLGVQLRSDTITATPSWVQDNSAALTDNNPFRASYEAEDAITNRSDSVQDDGSEQSTGEDTDATNSDKRREV